MPSEQRTAPGFLPGFLWAGLLAGLALTGFGLFEGSRLTTEAVPDENVAAVVNGRPISAELFHRHLESVQSDPQGETLRSENRRSVLDRMIDEELLVQEAIRIGMPSRDRLARGYLVQSMLEFISGRVELASPTESQLESYYHENQGEFLRPGKLSLSTLVFDVYTENDDERIRQRAARAREAILAGRDWSEVAKSADSPVIEVPVAPLDAASVLEYLGPVAARTAFGLAEGQVSEPVRTKSGYLIIRVNQRWGDKLPPLEEITADVELAWQRAEAERAVREYLAELRSAAEIKVAEGAVNGALPIPTSRQ